MHRMILVPALLAIVPSVALLAQAPLVYHVSLRDQIQLEHRRIVERAFQVADRDGAAAVVLELDLARGSPQAAQLIVRDIEQTAVPTVAWVNRAWGPGALIALATDSTLVTRSSSIGADPTGSDELDDLPEVARRALGAELHRLVERRGVDPTIGEAMVDPAVVIDGVVGAGELLTLEADAALELGLAAAEAGDLAGVLATMSLQGADVVTVGPGHTGVAVTVTNRNSRDIRVFLVRSTNRYRLGTVTSMSETQFDIPGELVTSGSTISLGVEIIGSSESASTEQIRMEPGLVIEWVIEAALSQSNYFVWIR